MAPKILIRLLYPSKYLYYNYFWFQPTTNDEHSLSTVCQPCEEIVLSVSIETIRKDEFWLHPILEDPVKSTKFIGMCYTIAFCIQPKKAFPFGLFEPREVFCRRKYQVRRPGGCHGVGLPWERSSMRYEVNTWPIFSPLHLDFFLDTLHVSAIQCQRQRLLRICSLVKIEITAQTVCWLDTGCRVFTTMQCHPHTACVLLQHSHSTSNLGTITRLLLSMRLDPAWFRLTPICR